MKARVKTLDLKFLISLCLLVSWLTLFFVPSQTARFIQSTPAGTTETLLVFPVHGDTFSPSELFKASLSQLSLNKLSPSAKFLPATGGWLTFIAGYSAVKAYRSAPVRDLFLFSPPNKASP